MTDVNDPRFVPRMTPEAYMHVDSVRGALRDGRLDVRAFTEALLVADARTPDQIDVWEDIVRRWAEGPVEYLQGSYQVRLIHNALLTTVPGFPNRDAAYQRWAR